MSDSEGPIRCLNCFTLIPDKGNYCPHCGQKSPGPHHDSMGHLILESVGDFFHFESKFFRTLRPLVFQPGYLTREYITGRRIRYFEPFKLFLFISFLYFLVSGFLEHKTESGGYEATPVVTGDSTNVQNGGGTLKLTMGSEFDTVLRLSNDSLRALVNKEGLDRFVRTTFPEAGGWSRFILKQVIKDRLNPSAGFFHNWKTALPKMVFFLIPILALLLRLLYRRGKARYLHHVIFSLHFLSFFFLITLIQELADLAITWFGPVWLGLILLYLYLALRRVYPSGVWQTTWRYVLFLLGSGVVLLLFFIVLAAVSLVMI